MNADKPTNDELPSVTGTPVTTTAPLSKREGNAVIIAQQTTATSSPDKQSEGAKSLTKAASELMVVGVGTSTATPTAARPPAREQIQGFPGWLICVMLMVVFYVLPKVGRWKVLACPVANGWQWIKSKLSRLITLESKPNRISESLDEVCKAIIFILLGLTVAGLADVESVQKLFTKVGLTDAPSIIFVIIASLLFGYLAYQMRVHREMVITREELGLVRDTVQKAGRAIDDANRTGVESLKLSTHMLANALSPLTDQRYYNDPELHNAVGKFYRDLGLAVRAWDKLTISIDANWSQKTLPANCSASKLMFRLGACYLRQESLGLSLLDEKKKETGGYITTSALNYVELLITILDELVAQVKDGKKIYYLAVTTANPSEFYNWPHGGLQGRGLWEAEYLRFFRLALHAIIHSNNNQTGHNLKDRILHERMVVTADVEATVPLARRLAWELIETKSVESACKTKILPLPVECPTDVSNCQMSDEGKRLCNLIQAINGEQQPRVFFPVYGEHLVEYWKKEFWEKVYGPPSTWAADAKTQLVAQQAKAGRCLSGIKSVLANDIRVDGAVISSLLTTRKGKLTADISTSIAAARKLLNGIGSQDLDEFESVLSSEEPCPLVLFSQWSRCRTDLCLKIAASMLSDALKAIKDAALFKLEQMELKRLEWRYGSRLNKVQDWPLVSEAFSNDWHSAPEHAHLVPLSAGDLTAAESAGVSQEFALFGIEDASGNPQWVFGLATDLEYPFDYERVDFLFEDKLEKHVKWQDTLRKHGDKKMIKDCK
jgi:hypothetical protein